MVRVMILWGLGFNCEEETEAAYRMAGAKPVLVHVNEFLKETYTLANFDILHIPGGFSFGDHLGAGRVLANRLRFKRTSEKKTFRQELLDFTKRGGFILGVCNGFQILVALNLFPGLSEEDEPRLSLVQNASGQFQNQWVNCSFNPQSPLAVLGHGDLIPLPMRHGEGRLHVPDKHTQVLLRGGNLLALSYLGENPNGSFESCAGLSDPSGRIFGMMPHPEAFLSAYNHPDWSRKRIEDAKGAGLVFFENLLSHVRGSR